MIGLKKWRLSVMGCCLLAPLALLMVQACESETTIKTWIYPSTRPTETKASSGDSLGREPRGPTVSVAMLVSDVHNQVTTQPTATPSTCPTTTAADPPIPPAPPIVISAPAPTTHVTTVSVTNQFSLFGNMLRSGHPAPTSEPATQPIVRACPSTQCAQQPIVEIYQAKPEIVDPKPIVIVIPKEEFAPIPILQPCTRQSPTSKPLDNSDSWLPDFIIKILLLVCVAVWTGVCFRGFVKITREDGTIEIETNWGGFGGGLGGWRISPAVIYAIGMLVGLGILAAIALQKNDTHHGRDDMAGTPTATVMKTEKE
jgi:hypothetical protein